MQNKMVHVTSFILVVVGALNWGLVGLFNLDLVDLILGSIPWLARLVYILVGVAGVYLLATHKKDCSTCGAGGGMGKHSAPSGGQQGGGVTN